MWTKIIERKEVEEGEKATRLSSLKFRLVFFEDASVNDGADSSIGLRST